MHFYTELHSDVKADYINVMGENDTFARAYEMDKNAGEAKFEEYDKVVGILIWLKKVN